MQTFKRRDYRYVFHNCVVSWVPVFVEFLESIVCNKNTVIDTLAYGQWSN